MQKTSSRTFTPVTPENLDLYLVFDNFSELRTLFRPLFRTFIFLIFLSMTKIKDEIFQSLFTFFYYVHYIFSEETRRRDA